SAHEHHDLARSLQRARQLAEASRRRESLALAAPGDEIVDARDGAVVHGDTEALALHVQRQVLAHHGESDEADVRKCTAGGRHGCTTCERKRDSLAKTPRRQGAGLSSQEWAWDSR